MQSSNNKLEIFTFFVILVFFSCAFLNIMLPFFGAIFWAIILTILFSPMQRNLEHRLKGKNNLAAFITVCICILIVVIPVIFVINSLFQESSALLTRMKEGKFDIGQYLQHIMDGLPAPLQSLMERMGWNLDIADIKDRLANVGMKALSFAGNQAYSIGQVTLQFAISLCVMLYLLFFLLRDGSWLGQSIKRAIPISDDRKSDLYERFSIVIRATVKGNIIVACIQGALGGIAFWFYGIQGAILWGTIMAVLSLLPAVGASLVWGPVAIYFLVTGMIWQGVSLIVFGAVVIGMIDNVLRPILVGKDTKLPDWLILLSTLGGISVFGINGFVLGPLVAAMFITVWAILTERRLQLEDTSQAESFHALADGNQPAPQRKKRRYYNNRKRNQNSKGTDNGND
ncbi:AI-2E family transporter [Entomomonas sp. E2T0]|uniref:AI-2E family transporter n=1 Tax=Entomomonas sp. E2T0 TaxID=2930213 RepID=UPI0022284918|nr:AI-2E family transporter [Entomomonas sp. E2T0]UYZ83252.1 AI-2E family transporter [Entomomonas sp. E2T0]